MEEGKIKNVDEVVNYFYVEKERGIKIDKVKRNKEKYGKNELKDEEGK